MPDLGGWAEGMGVPPVKPGRAEPQWEEVSEEPQPKHFDEAEAFVKPWLYTSFQRMQNMAPKWRLFYDLYRSKRSIFEWDVEGVSNIYSSMGRVGDNARKSLDDDPLGKEQPRWECDFSVSCSPQVDHHVQSIFLDCFAQDEYQKVYAASGLHSDEPPTPDDFTIAQKLQTLILSQNDEVGLKNSVKQLLRDLFLYGTCAAKVYWFERREQVILEDATVDPPQRMVRNAKILADGAALMPLKLSRFLPDPDAKQCNVMFWSGVGDWNYIPFDEAAHYFDTGDYNGDRKVFRDKFKDEGQPLPDADDEEWEGGPVEEHYNTGDPSPRRYLRRWEWHGEIPFSDGKRECVVTLLGDVSNNNPHGCMIARLDLEPAHNCGIRPYLTQQFVEEYGPYGTGLSEMFLPVYYLLSHLICLFTDSARLTSIPMLGLPAELKNELQNQYGGNIVGPGRVFWLKRVKDALPFALSAPAQEHLVTLIQYLERVLEKYTGVSDSNRGLSETKKTATEVVGLQQESDQIVAVHKKLFRENILDRFATIQMDLVRDSIERNQIDRPLVIRSDDGMPHVVHIIPEELKNQEFVSYWPMNSEAEAATAMAQTIISALPIFAEQEIPMLLTEGKKFQRSGLLEEFLRLTKMNRIDNVMTDATQQDVLLRVGVLAPQMMPLLMQLMGMAGPPQQPPDGAVPQEGLPPDAATPPQPGEEPVQPGMLPEDFGQLYASMQRNGQQLSPVNQGGGPAL